MWVAGLVSMVFAPELFVLVATLLLVGWERRGAGWRWRGLLGRVAVVGVAWALAFVVYQGGPALLSRSPPGGENCFASLGLIVGFALIGAAWRRRAWGSLLPAYCLLLVATSVVHLLVVPVWNVSSHVVYAAVPSGFLAVVDRRFLVLLVVPLGLAWSRVALGAHTLDQSLGALAVAAVLIAATVYSRRFRTALSLW
jgi:membrane-associated phospholipid phosphatase